VLEPVQVTAAPPKTEYPEEPASTGEVAANTLAGATRPSISVMANIGTDKYLLKFFIFYCWLMSIFSHFAGRNLKCLLKDIIKLSETGKFGAERNVND
jgi:hypothetical protein